jgi:hypothetical protein
MRLLDNLRSAEQKSARAVRQGMARAREEWGDVERRIRQRMRIYPQKLLRKKSTLAGRSEGELQPDLPVEAEPDPETRKPIVSVHGHDVVEEEIDPSIDHPAA